MVAHQPNYFPWVGFFAKLSRADTFVILDSVQYSNNSYTHRCMIRNKEKALWLTIPIPRKEYFKPINEVRLPQDNSWKNKHWKSILLFYSKAEHFSEIREFLERIFKKETFSKLVDLNLEVIRFFMENLNIKPKTLHLSELPVNENAKKTDLIINIMKIVQEDTYLSGMGGTRYIERASFEREDLRLKFFEFKPTAYKQRWKPFIPNLSILDLVANVGFKNARKYLKGRIISVL